MLKEAVVNYVKSKRWESAPALMEAWQAREKAAAGLLNRQHRNWALQVRYMIYFVLAHEIGHIVNRHLEVPEPEDQDARWEDEYQADPDGDRAVADVFGGRC